MTELSLAAPKPAHVPDTAVYDFDMYLDQALLIDPHERVRQILHEAPTLFWTPRNGGHWVAVGHKEVFAVSRDTETFSSVLMPPSQISQMLAMVSSHISRVPLPTPINMDPPDHTRYRAPLQLAFSPKAMLARREEIRALANSLIGKVIDKRQCESISEIAEPLPVQVFLKMMGLPIARQGEFRNLVHAFLAPPSGDPTEVLQRMRSVADAMKDVIETRQIAPQTDLISQLWQSEIDGKPMTLEIMEDYCVLLFIAGLDTVINGIGYGIRHLALNPSFQAELRANPKLIVDATEEILRRYTFTVPSRRVARDVEFSGCTMKEGDRLLIYLPAADLDPREFESPEKFNINRDKKTHIAFGAGPHRCLGSHLARIELQIIYEQLLSGLPAFRLDERSPVKFHAG